jgi:guanylate kinase
MDTPLDIYLSSYQPEPKTKEVLRKCQILVLVGPTGSGKDTITRELLKTGKYLKVVTYTTRKPREDHGVMEVNGKTYHFIDHKKARSMIQNKQFIEAALVHGNIYGTSLGDFEKATKESKTAVMDIDVQGVKSYMELTDSITPVFLLPPNFRVMLERLGNRYGANQGQDINVRLNTALFELYELLKTKHFTPIINDDLEQTIRAVGQIVEGKATNKNQQHRAKHLAQELIDDISKYLSD